MQIAMASIYVAPAMNWAELFPVRCAARQVVSTVLAAGARRNLTVKLVVGETALPEDRADVADIRASCNGDEEAFARLVRRHQEPISRYLWRFTHDRQHWEVLVHDVFVEAFLSLPGYRGDAPLLHWLKRIATRVGYRFWRSERRRRQREVPMASIDEPRSGAADQDRAAAEASEFVHQLLSMLSHRDRLVMTLVYLEGLTIREVAGLTGWSETLTKVQAHRARNRLRKLCHERGIEP